MLLPHHAVLHRFTNNVQEQLSKLNRWDKLPHVEPAKLNGEELLFLVHKRNLHMHETTVVLA